MKNQLGDWLINGQTRQILPKALQAKPGLTSFDRDKSLTVLFFILLSASIIGISWAWKIIIKKKKQQLINLKCANCGHQFQLDVNNPKNDAMPCAKCKQIQFHFKEKATFDTEVIQIKITPS